jgi:hypothetical protein
MNELKKYTLTFHYSKNYGAFLQAFALQNKINSRIIDFIPKWSFFVGKKAEKYPLIFRKFIGIHRSKKYISTFPENKNITLAQLNTDICNKRESDKEIVFIAGSDQIWNPKCIQNLTNEYFLNFTPDSCKRISYAASLGMSQWPKDFEQQVLPMLQRFDAISVREESSVPYLTSLGLKNVVCVCDPTILHKSNFYKEQFPATKVYKEEYAFVYKIREQIPKAVQETFPNKVITVDLQKRKTLVSVTDWLSYIDNAKFVVTDSFHCAVFCILFHKPFLVIPNQSTGKGMNERFATLLGKTSLEYRCLSCEESTEQVLEKLNSPIDWDHVDAVLEEWRTYSANWLKNALEN